MTDYKKKILNKLMDSYENSELFWGTNKVAIHIDFLFQKKNLPEYFDETSMDYETIHEDMKELEQKNFLTIDWKQGKKNHIIKKVLLNTETIDEIYSYLNRVPKAQLIQNTLVLLAQLREKYGSAAICQQFITWLIDRIQDRKSVKEYIDLETPEQTEQLVKMIFCIETNKTACYLRECSIQNFGDSKTLEHELSSVCKVLRKFAPNLEHMDNGAILAEYMIYQTPNYVYFKGDGILKIGGNEIALAGLRQGIGISGDDLEQIQIVNVQMVKQVITIENLTTFFRWNKPESILIYLGGYHNSVRQTLLRMIYEKLPDVDYFHFGDIDMGGFEIYEDLCRKTGIQFSRYCMDLATLKKYEQYARKMTENDKSRIEKKLTKEPNCEYREVLEYMLAKSIKLEQECVRGL